MLASFNRELRSHSRPNSQEIIDLLERRKPVIPNCEGYGFTQTKPLQPISNHDLDISKPQSDEFSQYGL